MTFNQPDTRVLTNLLALKKYEEDVQLVPDDPTPLGNLSAAQFEIGDYTQCISAAEKALTLLNGADKSVASADKLKRRIGRARAHYSQTPETELVEGRSESLNNIPQYRPKMYVWLPN
jgi:tetratricopeptide (TPR) repeat protein